MPFTVTKYPQGTFSWADIFSTDIAATKKFMMSLLGWTSEDMPTGDGPDYTMFFLDGKRVAGGSAMPENMKGMPSLWSSYITVNDADAISARVTELSGTVTMPAMDVLDAGRMVGIQDPTGANVMLWQPKKHIGAQIVNVPGAMGWNELYTKDVAKAKDFYTKLFGWTYEQMEGQEDYTVIKNNGRSNGGIVQITSEMEKEGMPPCWMVYFSVAKIDEALEKVKKLGGTVHMTMTVPVGTLAMIADPTHATFFIMESSVPLDEWIE